MIVVTHLHHEVDGASERDDQARHLLEWLDGGPRTTAEIAVGDFNADADEPVAQRVRAAGFRSAFAEANGMEPAVTWPSGIEAPGMDTDGDPACLDYIWIRGEVAVSEARLVFDRPDPADPTLYPSDHFGIAAWLEIGPPEPAHPS
jgi:endonuclease/exonuclease/phosphatase family metal-dependent hydrolase